MKLAFFIFLASIAPAVGVAAPACAPGTLAAYISLGSGGCTVGTITVADFRYVSRRGMGAPQVTPSEIQVMPSFGVPATAGLTFSARWQVGSGQNQESFIHFVAIPPASFSKAGSLRLQLGQASAGSFGDVEVFESTHSGNLRVFTKCGEVACRSQEQYSRDFHPHPAGVKIVDHVRLTAANTGSASLSGFTATIDYCPRCVQSSRPPR